MVPPGDGYLAVIAATAFSCNVTVADEAAGARLSPKRNVATIA
jgi:hypothetical protein